LLTKGDISWEIMRQQFHTSIALVELWRDRLRSVMKRITL